MKLEIGRWPWFAIGWLALAAAANFARGESFPYRAYVTDEGVHLRSGPGENYYPVMKLAAGDDVLVYRHDPGGWYAVRPPAGCFSWVLSEFVRPLEGRLGVITGERVVARVGSNFSDLRDVIQVRLDRGEEVEILEAQRLETGGPGGTAQTWYKIAPPAGEFRWVASKYLDRERPTSNARDSRAVVNQDIESWQKPKSSKALPDEKTRGNSDLAGSGSPQRAAQAAGKPKSGSGRVPSKAAVLGQLEDLDLELARRVTEEPSSWKFDDLTNQIEQLLARADNSAERNEARSLLGRISRFEDVRDRARILRDSGRGRTDVASAARRDLGGTLPANRERFDGVGKLAQVVAKKPDQPQFALLDPSGQVRCYVTAAPGVNLRSYLGEEIGITGTLGYLPDQHTQHVTAKRVSTLTAGGSTWR